ncbi:MAG: glycerol-3-phosphate dehydrogenase [Pseudomonadota bacterium]
MYDLLIIGGGINGAGIARDAAGRGLSVLLCEKDDLASHTSSASTKLIHGGLRYLEYYDFALVRKALIEREVLLKSAPHIIWPMRFVLPQNNGTRPAWLVRLGLFLYDHLGGREILPGTKTLKRGKSPRLDPLKSEYARAFEYSDCWVEDSRLVTLNAVDAKERGAVVMTRTECTILSAENGMWTATLNSNTGETKTVSAKAVINAAGPWVDQVAGFAMPKSNAERVRLVKGSHIIVDALFEGEQAYFFQNQDGRIIFAIPYENGAFTLIGTTDEAYDDNPQNVKISNEEIDYLCECANEYFQKRITSDDVVSTYSGVRPLYDDKSADASAVTRDYVLSTKMVEDAKIVSVYGGKITTYRKLAEDVIAELGDTFPNMGPKWTKDSHLPGGDIPNADFEVFFQSLTAVYPWLETALLRRLLRAYGTRIKDVLGTATSVDDLGHHYGSGLYQKEIDYLLTAEFAQSADDILYRRSKLYLQMSEQEQSDLRSALTDRDPTKRSIRHEQPTR